VTSEITHNHCIGDDAIRSAAHDCPLVTVTIHLYISYRFHVAMSVSVCLSVCLFVRSHTRQNFTTFSVYVLLWIVARSSSDNNE